MITVHLTWNEVEFAADAGKHRFITPIRQGSKNRYGAKESWDNDISACLAELAVAKYTGQYWHAAPALYGNEITNDVGDELEVRCSRTEKLIIRSGDKDDRYYLLVLWPQYSQTGCCMTIAGGMRARDARQPQWWEAPGNRPGAYFVPKGALIDAYKILRSEAS